MQYGVTLPDHVDAPALVALGQEAEEAGWDGVFLWDPVWGLDPWITLTGVALRTTRVRLGTMLTPVSRRRPWTLASQLATLDHLSGGRVILPVGLGAAGPEHTRSGFARVGEETNRTVRAQLLDEALEIVTGLWSGAPLHYQGPDCLTCMHATWPRAGSQSRQRAGEKPVIRVRQPGGRFLT